MSAVKIIDGAMGSELIQRGLSLLEHTWSAQANLEFPKTVTIIASEELVKAKSTLPVLKCTKGVISNCSKGLCFSPVPDILLVCDI